MPESIRSFVALELPLELKFKLKDFLDELKKTAPKVKWVKSESIHITLKFLGNQPTEIIDKTMMQLMNVPKSITPFSLTTNNFGAFPGSKHPRVFWLGLNNKESEQLNQLQHRVENALQALGFEKEKRKFSAHLTLGRVKVQQNFTALWEVIEKTPFPVFSFEVNEFVLMRSILKPQGAVYRPLQKYSLQG